MKLHSGCARVGLLWSAMGWLLIGACGGDGAKTFGGDPGTDTGGSGSSSTGGAGGRVIIPGSGGAGLFGSGGASGVGGSSGTGGRGAAAGGNGTGNGGRIGSGGMIGGAGGLASSGSGGRNGTGGAGGGLGMGGRAGTGGISASGGVSGTGGSTSTVCDELVAAYDKEMPSAKMCTTLSRGSCAAKAPQTLGCSACLTYVDDATRLDKIAAEWTNDSCVRRNCPKPTLCLAVTGATCSPSAAQSVNGTCMDTTGVLTSAASAP